MQHCWASQQWHPARCLRPELESRGPALDAESKLVFGLMRFRRRRWFRMSTSAAACTWRLMNALNCVSFERPGSKPAACAQECVFGRYFAGYEAGDRDYGHPTMDCEQERKNNECRNLDTATSPKSCNDTQSAPVGQLPRRASHIVEHVRSNHYANEHAYGDRRIRRVPLVVDHAREYEQWPRRERQRIQSRMYGRWLEPE
jgi:hypothetical protein